MAMRSASRANSSSVVRRRSAAARAPGTAVLARAVNLQHALARGESARGGDLLDQRLDVGAEELERLVAGLADQMEVPRMAVGVLEPEPALAEIDLARDAGIDHPLQRAVDRGPADALVLTADQIDELVGAEVPFLPQEDVDDEVALAGALAACGPQLSTSGGGESIRYAAPDRAGAATRTAR